MPTDPEHDPSHSEWLPAPPELDCDYVCAECGQMADLVVEHTPKPGVYDQMISREPKTDPLVPEPGPGTVGRGKHPRGRHGA